MLVRFVKRYVTELVCYSQVGGMRNMPVSSVIRNMQQTEASLSWSGPSLGPYKCNIDASFSAQHNKVGTGMCIRDDQCHIVLAKTEWMTPCTDVDLGEALGLLNDLKWVNDLQLNNMDFEIDSKRVADCLYSDKMKVSELGAIINDCRRL
jgi:hypothetical protein